MDGNLAGNSRRCPSIGLPKRTGRLEPARNADDGQPWLLIETDPTKQAGAVMRSVAEVDTIGPDDAN